MNLLKKIKQKIVDEALLRMLELYKEKKWQLLLVDSNYDTWKISFKKVNIGLGDLPHKNKPTKDLTLEMIEDCSNKLKELTNG